MYTVVQCGSAGHNLRSIPSMRGTPVGRLTKGSTVSVVQEVSNLVLFVINNLLWFPPVVPIHFRVVVIY